jgi:hypothetical protein
MPKRNRKTLKECFGRGRRPSEVDFENLIDSTINVLDDGFSKSAETGIALAPIQGKSVVMSVFRKPEDDSPEWEIAVDEDSGNLLIGRPSEAGTLPLLRLKSSGEVELGITTRGVQLNGAVSCDGRKGSYKQGRVPADGHWHSITDELEGCWALEVVAGCGRKNTGKHALLVATAMHCFGAKPRIKAVDSHYGQWGNRIRLRWVCSGFSGKLQIKTTFNYGEGIAISYNIARLWDAPYMEEV